MTNTLYYTKNDILTTFKSNFYLYLNYQRLYLIRWHIDENGNYLTFNTGAVKHDYQSINVDRSTWYRFKRTLNTMLDNAVKHYKTGEASVITSAAIFDALNDDLVMLPLQTRNVICRVFYYIWLNEQFFNNKGLMQMNKAQGTMAEELASGRNEINAAIRWLVDRGWLIKSGHYGIGVSYDYSVMAAIEQKNFEK